MVNHQFMAGVHISKNSHGMDVFMTSLVPVKFRNALRGCQSDTQ